MWAGFFYSFQPPWHSSPPPPPVTWQRTEAGGTADLPRCITLTDRLIVDKQLKLNASAAAVISAPAAWPCADVYCDTSPPGCFIPHFHWAIKGASVELDAAAHRLVFGHRYGVTDTITRTGEEGGVEEGESVGGDCNWSRGRSRPGSTKKKTDHLSIHLHMPETQMTPEQLVTQRGRTQSGAQSNVQHLIRLHFHWEPAMRLQSVFVTQQSETIPNKNDSVLPGWTGSHSERDLKIFFTE